MIVHVPPVRAWTTNKQTPSFCDTRKKTASQTFLRFFLPLLAPLTVGGTGCHISNKLFVRNILQAAEEAAVNAKDNHKSAKAWMTYCGPGDERVVPGTMEEAMKKAKGEDVPPFLIDGNRN